MTNNPNNLLKSVSSFEEFEKLKLNIKVFEDIVRQILTHHNLPITSLVLFSEGTNIVFSYDDRLVIKLFPPFHQDQFESEKLVLQALEGKLSVKTPSIHSLGEISGWPYIIMTKLNGTLLEALWDTLNHNNKLVIIKELGALIREVHSLSTIGLESLDCHWTNFIKNQIECCVENHVTKKLSTSLLKQIPSYISMVSKSLLKIEKLVLLTGEYTPMNFLVTNFECIWHISGLIDFGDAMLGSYKYDLLGPGAFLIQGNKELLNAFLSAYGYLPHELNSDLSHQLTALMLLHKYSNLEVQVRIDGWKNKAYSLKELEQLVWGF
ncbi:MAG: aminoglycoside phosphotransferase family protein [Alphaproteobacteria bacterium]